MKSIGISLRVEQCQYPSGDIERRDAIDQRWFKLLSECGCVPIMLPNNLASARLILKTCKLDGVLLTGGNSPSVCGGDAPERDEVEQFLVEWASENIVPLIGVCRGMQSIQLAFGQELCAVEGHISKSLAVTINSVEQDVNSYHSFASYQPPDNFRLWAHSDDGVVKAISHNSLPIHGVMWHPERTTPFSQRDILFFKQVFNS